MERNEPSWRLRESWRCCCITCGSAAKSTIRCTIAAERQWQQPRKTETQNKSQKRSRKRKDKSQSRVPVTALMAWPRFHSARAEPQGAKQMAAPAEPRTPNVHRAKRVAPRECGWKHGDSGHSAGEQRCFTKPVKNQLDSDRPSHGRPLHSEF